MRQNVDLVLASASPRRRELLEQIGVKFQIIPSDVAEVGYGGTPEMIPQRIVTQKVKSVKARLGANFTGWILGADTVVVLDNEVFGKPNDKTHATSMLQRLSGKEHRVITAVRLEDAMGELHQETVITKVRFAELSTREIENYVATGEPDDKAGAYAIQGKANYMVKSIEGSYTNVVGLPMHETISMLVNAGVISF